MVHPTHPPTPFGKTVAKMWGAKQPISVLEQILGPKGFPDFTLAVYQTDNVQAQTVPKSHPQQSTFSWPCNQSTGWIKIIERAARKKDK